MSNAPAPPSGAQQQPGGEPLETPKAARFPWKTKARVGDAEHEFEVDLAEYRHKVKIDGQEHELGLDELTKGQERLRSSMKRYDEAAKMRRDVEQREQALDAKVQRLEQSLQNPQSAARILKRALGEDGFYDMLAQELAQRVEYERLPPEQRAQFDRTSKRENDIARREQDIARREAEAKRIEEQRVSRLASERQQQMIAEWVPALEAAGLPAKFANGEVNGPLLARVADTLRTARANKVPLTLREAVSMVREEYDALISHHTQRQQQQAVSAIEAQPGRREPAAPTTPAAPPRQRGRATSLEELQRQLQQSWRR